MDKLWAGTFFNPIMKHRDFCGDITNHFIIKSVKQLTEDEAAAHDDDDEADLLIEDLTQIGDGEIPYLTALAFIHDEDEEYEFVVWSDSDKKKDIEKHLAESLKHP